MTDDSSAAGAAAPAADAASKPTLALVEHLVSGFREQVRRAVDCELDWSATSLAFVDHYLSLAADEDREAIVSLVASGAGAYLGEVVRREIGGTWIGDGKDPRRLRLLLSPQFVHFSPVDLAYESIMGGADEEGLPDEVVLDTPFRLSRSVPETLDEASRDGFVDDATWIEQRLSELPPVPMDQYYTLTGRYETLKLILELLAVKHRGEGRSPTTYELSDYVAQLVDDA
jgi:hypothetical protein